MAKLFELRPKKDLLDPSFEGYKLTLDSLAVYKHDLPGKSDVENLKPSDEQYSFQHVKIFGLHNHLVSDPWLNNELSYFITSDLQIIQVKVHSLASQHPEFQSVFKLPERTVDKSGCFNTTLSFPGPETAVVSDGSGSLYVLQTSIRDTSSNQPWQMVPSEPILSSNKPFKILDSLLDESREEGISLTVLLQRVDPIDEVETQVALSTLDCNEKETPFVNCVEYHRFECNKDGKWVSNQFKRLAIPRGLDYASILPSGGKSLCLIAREPLGIIYDSVKTLLICKIEDQAANQEGDLKPLYTWSDNPEEVIMRMIFTKTITKYDFVIQIQRQSLKIVFKNQVLLQGELLHSISPSESVWTLSDGKLELLLQKVDKTQNWDNFITNDTRGEKVLDSTEEWQHKLIHTTSEELSATTGRKTPIFSSEQLEECDEMSYDETCLLRFDTDTNEFTHKANLGGHQFLFSMPPQPQLAAPFCLRHDVDGLIWQPMREEDILEEQWLCLHTVTLQAIGYIQASKEQRKFTVSPPNNSYTAVCDAFHHLFIYRSPDASSNGVELVHRPTGRKIGTVARQQVLNLDSQEELLGVLATDTFLLILTSSSIFAVRINSD